MTYSSVYTSAHPCARVCLLFATLIGVLWNLGAGVTHGTAYWYNDTVYICAIVMCFVIMIVYGVGFYGAITEKVKVLQMFVILVVVTELIYVILLIAWVAMINSYLRYSGYTYGIGWTVVNIVLVFLFVFFVLYVSFLLIKALKQGQSEDTVFPVLVTD